MKKIFSILLALSALTGFAAGVTSCIEQPELMETLDLGACLTPSSTSMTISTETGRDVTFTWTNSKGATDYVLEIFESATNDAQPEDVFEGTPVEELNVASAEGTSTSTTVRLTEGKYYYARVKAQELDADGNPLSEDSHWATFPYPIEPYLVMDDIPSFTVTERTSSSITVAWEIAEGDTDGVNQIRLTPDPENSQAAYKAFEVASDVRTLTIDKLPASTKFTIAAHYGSANRGTVYPWTRPDDTGFTPVSTVEEFTQAITDKASQILVKYSDGLIYDMGQMSITASSLTIIGEETVDGDKPTIIGSFSLVDGVTDFRAEALAFNGNSYDQAHLISFPSAINTTINGISVINCDLTGFKRGLIYAGSNVVSNVGSIIFDNVYMTDISGDGGEAFGFRSSGSLTGTIGSISVTNSTFSDGIREFFRVDDNYTIGSFTFRNNTLNNLGTGANSYGLFYIRATVSNECIFSNNVIMNMADNSAHGVDGRYPWGASAFVPTVVSNNFWYNLGSSDTFFTANFTESNAIAGGGAMLSSDPCVDSQRGTFNVTNTTVLNAKAGDPRWFADYVPAPVPDLVPVEYGYSWTLNDTYTFYDVVDQSTVRGNLKFIIASTPINIIDEGMEFSGEGTTAYGGVPTDGAIAFLVNGPGSIYASALASASGSTNDHITVAVGDAEGLRADVVGSIHVGAENEKIVFDQLEPDTEYLIYLYACGPVVLSTLEWSDDVNTGSTAVSDPDVTPTAGEGTLSLSWDAVENASGYVISFGAKEPDAEYGEDEYIIETSSTSYNWADFPSGTYTVNVQAIAADPTKNENSQIIGKTVTVTAPASLPQLTSATLTQEDMEFLLTLTEGKEINGNAETGIASSIYYKGFLFTGRSGKVSKFNSSENYGAFFNTGGSSDFTSDNAGRTIRFAAAGPGKLTYVVCSNGSDNRTAGVAVNHTEDAALATTQPQPTSMPADWDDWTLEKDLSTVTAGNVIDLYSTKSVNYISVTWIPAGGIAYDETAINEPYTMDASKFTITGSKETANVVIDNVTYGSNAKKGITFSASETEGVKFGGASDVGDNGIPENRYVMFKTTKPGTIGYKALTSSTGNTKDRLITIILVKYNDSGIQEIIKLVDGETVQDKTSDAVMKTVEVTEAQLADTQKTAEVYIYPSKGSSNLAAFSFTPAS